MRIQENHAHADTKYKALTLVDFYRLLKNIVETKQKKYTSLTVHLPYELQHPHIFHNKKLGNFYIKFGELFKKILGINLVWENAPALVVGKWSLAYGQTNFDNIPTNVNLCLDTGHLMLSSKNPEKTISTYLKRFGKQIKHIHLHENDLKTDQHIPPSKYLNKKLVKEIIHGRTWIIEKPD